MTSNSTIQWDGFVRLRIPEPWEWEEADGTISIYDPNGVGALQLSFAQQVPEKAMVDLEEMTRELAAKLAAPAIDVLRTTLGDALAAYGEAVTREAEPSVWRLWHVVRRNRVARVTYTCARRDADVERSQIDSILASCEWLY